MKKLILGCLLALFASGCNDNEPEQKPVELKISFAGENPVEFTVGEQKRLAFTVPDRDTWDDFADDQDRYVDGTSEWDGEKYGMTYIFGDLRDWYPTSGYRNRDKGNLAGLATTRTGHYWSNYRSGNTISCFYISKKLSTGKLLQPQSSSKSDAAYGYNVRCCRE